uniref:RRM domain-containing protein n=1 Tax=Chromera velia CCMP2878 TaxID=1169474 RepID=A0A0K6SB53_9ALVE|eukprot:Cvel_13297.t1-p1 / transcript=Cvel_13297.t1 / gene=Cvel_13297 / organism=Chromera_velia_CCMP2878 / gene_product=Polyadenylate-binding protein 2, putative / transcript_product=Polyadenylate-binding protein 2, putative / location=Cvel_scaffold902:29484-35659(+) / protein_length=439 / sequence_SO=supercontig / SO=protein_coding / is_pseudo=false
MAFYGAGASSYEEGSAKKRRPDEISPSVVGAASPDDKMKALLDMLSQQQLIEVLQQATSLYPQVAELVRQKANSSTASRRLMLRNLPFSTTTEDLQKIFGKFGPIADLVVCREPGGKSKGFGFLTFESVESVEGALTELVQLEGRTVNVKLAAEGGPSRDDRDRGEAVEKSTKLFVRNLSDNMDDETLRKAFSPFGRLAEVAVMKRPDGTPKGFGFVTFEQLDDACKAVADRNKIIDGRLVFISFATKNKDRMMGPGGYGGGGGFGDFGTGGGMGPGGMGMHNGHGHMGMHMQQQGGGFGYPSAGGMGGNYGGAMAPAAYGSAYPGAGMQQHQMRMGGGYGAMGMQGQASGQQQQAQMMPTAQAQGTAAAFTQQQPQGQQQMMPQQQQQQPQQMTMMNAPGGAMMHPQQQQQQQQQTGGHMMGGHQHLTGQMGGGMMPR